MTKFWIGCYTDAAGIQRQRSTRETDRRRAEKIAYQWEEAYRRRQTEAQMRRVLSDIHEDLHGAPLNEVKFGQFLDDWLAKIAPEVSPFTLKRYEKPVASLKKLRPALAEKQIDRVETKDLVDLRNAMLERNAPSTVNLDIKILSIAMRAAWQDGLIPGNPASRVPRVRRDSDAEGRRAFTLPELRKLLSVCDDEWRGMVYASLYTGGQRLGDIARLTPSRVDFESGTIRFKARKPGRWVVLPMVAPLARDLQQRAKGVRPTAPLFPNAFAKLTPEGGVERLSSQFGRLLFKAGLAENPSRAKAKTEGRRTAKGLTFHSLRHTATSILKNAGISDSVVMDIVGHESEAVSANYTHIDDKTKRAALAKLPDLTAA